MKYLLACLILFLFWCGFYLTLDNTTTIKGNKKDLENNLYKLAEMAYFEGQRDAINGDVRIKLGEDSVYHWTKSPWDGETRQPQFIPTINDTKKK